VKSLQSGTSVILPKMEACHNKEKWKRLEMDGRCHEATLPGKIEWGLGCNT